MAEMKGAFMAILPGADPIDVPSATPLPPTPEPGGAGAIVTPTITGTPPRHFVDGQVYIAGVGSFERAGATFVHLFREVREDGGGNKYRLLILAGDADTLSAGLNIITSGNLANCTLSDYTALCRGGEGTSPPATATSHRW